MKVNTRGKGKAKAKRDQSPATFIRQLRKRPGKDIWLLGVGELARDFLKADLVDELYLGMVPVLLGEGIPLFPKGFPQRDFLLVQNKTYSKGLIALKYKRCPPKGKTKVLNTSRGCQVAPVLRRSWHPFLLVCLILI
jgi:dihydrofolate reductase